jgi:hypothetical protein
MAKNNFTLLGRTQLMADCEDFMRRILLGKQAAGIARARERTRLERLAASLELKLDDAATILGRSVDDPLTVLAVVYATRLERARSAREAENAEEYGVSFLNDPDNLDF